MSNSIYTGTCPKCQKSFTKKIKWGYTPKYCSRSCANSRGSMSEQRKQENREYAHKNPTGFNKDRSLSFSGDPSKYKKSVCPTCKSIFSTLKSSPRVHCSTSCVKSGGLRAESYRHGKKGIYNSILCDSSWELAYVIYCLDHNISIKRNTTPLLYINPNTNTIRKYYPDFITNNELVEIKGYMDVVSKAKSDQNPSVKVLQRKEMLPIFDYIKKSYNKNQNKIFELYEKHL